MEVVKTVGDSPDQKPVGTILSLEEVKRLGPGHSFRLIRPVCEEVIPQAIKDEMKRTGRKWLSRNSRCLCGSGKRFKKCCMQIGG